MKGIVFDFNGVIVDDYLIQKSAWDTISFQLRGTPVTDQEMIESIRGVQTKSVISWLSKKLSREININDYAQKKERLVRNAYEKSPLYKLNIGLSVFLDSIVKEKVPCTIASSSSLESITFAFDRLKLARWFSFDKIIYNDGIHKGKPAPDPYLLAAKMISKKPHDCVVFEDASSGIQSAYAAGINTIIAIGNAQRLKILTSLPGVVKGIRNFNEITLKEVLEM